MHEVCLNGPLFSVYALVTQFFKEEPKKKSPTKHTHICTHTSMYIWLFFQVMVVPKRLSNIRSALWKFPERWQELPWRDQAQSLSLACGRKWGKGSSAAQPNLCNQLGFCSENNWVFYNSILRSFLFPVNEVAACWRARTAQALFQLRLT